MPSSQILAIEQLHGFAPLRRASSFQRGRPLANPCPRSSIGSGGSAGQNVPTQPTLEDHVIFPFLIRLGRDKRKNAVREFSLRKRPGVSPTAHQSRLQLSILLLQLQPGGVFTIRRLEG